MTNRERWTQWEQELIDAGWERTGTVMWEKDGTELIMYEALKEVRNG